MTPVMKRGIILTAIVTVAAMIAGCGPNDRLRDDYMGKPKPEDYRSVERDEYGNPILKD